MKLGWIAALPLLLTACGGGDDGSSSASAPDSADAIKSGVASISKAVAITEDNDPNDLIGRTNGYEAATVFYDSRVSCDGLGVDCGATLEVWPDSDAAQARAELLKAAGPIANEYDYLDGATILRVSGELKPSQAAEYEAAFTG